MTVIIQDGLRRMCQENEDGFYYISVYNENYAMPEMPADCEEGILKGIYKLPASRNEQREGKKDAPRPQLFGSGPLLNEACRAQSILAERFGINSDVWSVTSYSQLFRDAQACQRRNRLHVKEKPRQSYLEQALEGLSGPFISVSDNVRLVADQIRPWVPGPYVTLGTDGFGRSDTRSALRRHFEIDAEHTVYATLSALSEQGQFDKKKLSQAIKEFGTRSGEARSGDCLGCRDNCDAATLNVLRSCRDPIAPVVPRDFACNCCRATPFALRIRQRCMPRFASDGQHRMHHDGTAPMTVEFKLPLISEGVEAADIAAVHVHEGDMVEAGQIVLEVETEKAVAEIPSPQAGRIGKILVKPGQTVKIGELLLTIDECGSAGGERRRPPPRLLGERSRPRKNQLRQKPATEAAPPAKEEAAQQPAPRAAAAPKKAEPSPAPATKPAAPAADRRRPKHRQPRAGADHRRLADGRR